MENIQPKKKVGKPLTKVLIVVGIIILISFGTALSGSGNQPSASDSNQTAAPATQDNSDLNATVNNTVEGITITNNESSPWTNCMVGINGGTGWGFDSPPYKTQNPLTIVPGKQMLVSYSRITLQDGTTFDPTTHAINNVVVECFQGTGNLRDWIGSSSS